MSSIRTETVVIDYVLKSSDINKAKADFDKLTDAEKKAVDETKKLNDTLKTTGKEGSTAIKSAGNELNNFSSIAKSGAGLIAGFFAVSSVVEFGKEILRTTAQFQQYQKVLDFTSGSQKQGAISMQTLKDTADRLGISLISAVEGYKTLSGAATQAGLSNNQTRKIFDNVAKSVAAFGLSADDAKGVFLALGQIISKGTVSAEELRGQIGERIPGAFSIAAKSIGKTEAELNKMLQTGQVTSREFVIPFTEALAKAASAADGPEGLTQKVNRISNAFEVLKTRLGQGLLGPTGQVGNLLERALNLANKLLETQSDKQAVVNTRAYEKATKDAANATEEALKISIANQNAKIRLAKTEFDLINERVTIDGKLTSDEEDQINRQRTLILQMQSYRDGLFDALKGRKENRQEIILTEAELKKEMELELSMLKILTDIRKLETDSKAGSLGADKAFYNAKLSILEDFSKRGVKISQEEKDLVKAQSKKAGEDLIQQDKKDHMESKNELDAYLKSSAKSYEEYLEQVKKKKLELAKTDKQGNKDFVQDETAKWNEIVRITQAYSQLASQITQGFADLQYSRIQNEITLLNKKYDEEVRLAGDNQQKLAQIAEKREVEEKALRTKQFEAQRQAAIAEVVFRTAPIIAQQLAGVITAPLAVASYAAAAAQIAFILAQPVPEFAEGTKGTPFKGTAIVGERGPEKVVTESGKVYFTPGVATLAQFDEPVQIIPNNQLGLHDRQHLSLRYANSTKADNSGMQIVSELAEIKKGLAKMPVAAISLDEKGFMKAVKTQSRTTKILNNRMRN